MSVSGLCTVCSTAAVEHGCDRCGGLVCDDHWDAQTGLCAECAAEVGNVPGGNRNTDPDRPDGVGEYRF